LPLTKKKILIKWEKEKGYRYGISDKLGVQNGFYYRSKIKIFMITRGGGGCGVSLQCHTHHESCDPPEGGEVVPELCCSGQCQEDVIPRHL
jgi:hypothetical protein